MNKKYAALILGISMLLCSCKITANGEQNTNANSTTPSITTSAEAQSATSSHTTSAEAQSATSSHTTSAEAQSFTITWLNYDGTVLETDTLNYGETPFYEGITPVRESDFYNTYSFSGWYPEICDVVSDATYTATYESEKITYTVTWADEDGTVLEIDDGLIYGMVPSYDGEEPSKEPTQEHTFVFSGWDKDIEAVTCNTTYTATYESIVNCYTVTWKDYDGTVIEQDLNVPYGSMPTFDGATPVREGNAQYSYSFTGWNADVVPVTCDVTYTAVYNGSINGYSITWVNYDGTVLSIDKDVPYGSMPQYKGESPKKNNNAEYSYYFADWYPTISSVTGDMTYTAVFSSKVNGYTVTWKNYDGTILEEDHNVLYGNDPSYDGETPTRPMDEQYLYSFSGWSPIVTSVTGDVTYIAQYEHTKNAYTVTWKNYDGTVLEEDLDVPYGTIPSFDGDTPTKSGNAQYSYSFKSWDKTISKVTGDVVYTACFETNINKYTVTFKNYDGTVLETATVEYGADASYSGSTPVRETEGHKSYEFKGWDASVANIKTDTVVVATYTEFDVYSFDFANGRREEVKVASSSSITPYIPANTETSVFDHTEYTYHWENSSDFEYTEVQTARGVYSVSYELNGGNNDPNNPYTVYQDSVYSLNDAEKTGYTFVSWCSDPELKNEVAILSEVGSDLTLYAKYVLTDYTITYHLDSGVNALKNPDTFTIEDSFALKEATKTGYTFEGWYTEVGYENRITVIDSIHRDIDLYARFTANTYVAHCYTYNNPIESGGDSVITVVFPYCKEKITLTNSNRSFDLFSLISPGKEEVDISSSNNGHTKHFEYQVRTDAEGNQSTWVFLGFSTSMNNYKEVSSNLVLTSDYTVYALYTPAYMGHIYQKHQMQETRVFSKPLDPVSTANSVDYLEYDASESAKLSPYTITGLYNYTLYAGGNSIYSNRVYVRDASSTTRVKYYVSLQYGDAGSCLNDCLTIGEPFIIYNYFVDGGGGYPARVVFKKKSCKISLSTTLRNVTVTFDETINGPTLSKNGYTFKGWTDSDGNLIKNWSFDHDEELYPCFEAIKYKVNYVLNGGTNNSSNRLSYTVEDDVTLANPKRVGYTFEGWYSDSGFANQITSLTGMTSDITLYAKWSIKMYTVSIDSDGGDYRTRIRFHDGDTVCYSTYLGTDDFINGYYPPDKTGYVFGGWFLDEELTVPFEFSGTVESDIDLYAKWIENVSQSITIKGEDAVDLIISGKNEQLIAFSPLVSGTITISSSSSLDLLGTLYDENMKSLVICDDISDTDLNYSITINVKAGHTYFIGTKGNQTSTSGHAQIQFVFDGQTGISGSTYSVETYSYTYGEYFYLPEYVEKEGYTFAGWYDDDGNRYESGYYLYDSDLTLHAEWIAI